MFTSRTLTERLFSGAPPATERADEYADACADLVMNALSV